MAFFMCQRSSLLLLTEMKTICSQKWCKLLAEARHNWLAFTQSVISTSFLTVILFSVTFVDCSGVKRLSESETIQLEFKGYLQTGMPGLTISLKEHGGWRQVNPAPIEPHYLVDQFVNYRWPPDVITCRMNTTPISVRLVEYVEIGTRKSPPEAGSAWGPELRVYKTVPLRGEIRIQFKYSKDSTCSNESIFTQIIKR